MVGWGEDVFTVANANIVMPFRRMILAAFIALLAVEPSLPVWFRVTEFLTGQKFRNVGRIFRGRGDFEGAALGSGVDPFLLLEEGAILCDEFGGDDVELGKRIKGRVVLDLDRSFEGTDRVGEVFDTTISHATKEILDECAWKITRVERASRSDETGGGD
jgi:hypothetical protein